ncbi:MAG: hypothetical protein JSU73_03420 [candidate division WOR-3 bacterium]|nr:MAG: hypothetical protein JSU73_03420 [candidate division WOR-3 bacterium]
MKRLIGLLALGLLLVTTASGSGLPFRRHHRTRRPLRRLARIIRHVTCHPRVVLRCGCPSVYHQRHVYCAPRWGRYRRGQHRPWYRRYSRPHRQYRQDRGRRDYDRRRGNRR